MQSGSALLLYHQGTSLYLSPWGQGDLREGTWFWGATEGDQSPPTEYKEGE